MWFTPVCVSLSSTKIPNSENSFSKSICESGIIITEIKIIEDTILKTSLFFLGKINSNIIGISARSLGNVNVQKLMEKLNGGGHITDAACQMYNTTLIDAKKQLVKLLEKHGGMIQWKLYL